jgi:hypothetical protein
MASRDSPHGVGNVLPILIAPGPRAPCCHIGKKRGSRLSVRYLAEPRGLFGDGAGEEDRHLPPVHGELGMVAAIRVSPNYARCRPPSAIRPLG